MPTEYHYGPSQSQVADLYLPDRQNPPVVALLHGGFWKAPYGKDQMAPMALDLCKREFAVWNIEYRRLGEAGGGWPGTLDDVVAAIAFLDELANDAALPLNLGKFALIGHSAGGHLALACTSLKRRAWADRQPSSGVRLRAVLGLAAVTDLHAAFADNSGGGAVRSLLGGSPEDFPQRYADASPALLLPHRTREVLLHGINDDAVPIAQSRQYAQEASYAGDDVEYLELSGVDHMAFLDPQSSAHSAVCRKLCALFSP
ncbi:alpha/beta hydrolase [Nostoc sp. NIES-2111]